MTDSPIAGRTVVITGAAGGIGRALAEGFLRDGADVVGGDIEEVGLAELSAQGARTLRTDVTSDEQVRALIEFARSGQGRVDVLVNNAGVGGLCEIESLPDGQFEAFVAVHLFSAIYALRAALPIMRAQAYGRVINMVSRGAESRQSGWASYGCAKAGLFALTRVAAAEMGDAGVRVNGMIPGPTNTGMNRNPSLQSPEATYASGLWLATLPADGPTGKVFWDRKEYRLFADDQQAALLAGKVQKDPSSA